MNLCVIREDRVVVIDGESMNFDFELPTNIWAIQWNGTTGEIEFNDGSANEVITDISAYQALIDGHSVEKERIKQAEAQVEVDRIANMTFNDKRSEAYPSKEEQLDMQYWDAVNGTTVWVDAIAEVKLAIPKV